MREIYRKRQTDRESERARARLHSDDIQTHCVTRLPMIIQTSSLGVSSIYVERFC